MPRTVARQRANTAALPEWVVPQLTQLVETAPDGDQWLHEIKYDGYRMHQLTPFAQVEGLRITYPPEQATLL